MKNILVLGGNGFLGSHLVNRLSIEKFNITVYDRAHSHQTIENRKNLTFINGNFEDTPTLLSFATNADIIFHFLGTTVPSTANANPIYDIQSNLINTLRLIQGLKNSKCKRIVYISSGGTVYGNPVKLPVNEKHQLDPIGSYGIVKTAIEHYIKLYADMYDFSYCILRPSNPYGPGQNYLGNQGVISSFLYRAIINKPIKVWGDGKSVRDYIYVDDFIDLTLKAGLSQESGIFNVGSGIGNSVLDIIKCIEKSTDLKLEIEYEAQNYSGVNKVILDISKSKQTFNWRPKHKLDFGIIKQYKWIKNKLLINTKK